MIVVNIFGEIEPIVISKKLGITLSNLPQDWQEELIETMEEEIHRREYDIKKLRKYSNIPNIEQYNIKKIVEHKNFSGIFGEGSGNCLKKIASNLMCVSVEDFENSMLQKKNSYIDSPTCEREFGEKMMNLYKFLTRSGSKNTSWLPLTCLYSSEKSLFEETHVLRMIYAEMGLDIKMSPIIFNQKRIDSLLGFGEIIDSFLENTEDFYMFDYILTAIADDSNYNAYHIFKNYSLIEMILGKDEIDNPIKFDEKLSLFIKSDRYSSKKKLFAKMIRQIRNKIAHGNFIEVREKLEEYAAHFMKNYHFDYLEYSRENWIYLNICCELDIILTNILWELLSESNVSSHVK
ncbi:hypothetical protein DXT76_12105 [Halobacillus trueperi]|uniref:Apea-like HEPN domain-containing protein n=2 Tax=Halobacillus TaxID=45667 RepID=A0A1H0G1D9_HALAD|nr:MULTISPECIES: hypothetical protein [Halobacillus]RDY70659.1 hypothetical protein DXT76_12105 [Halobacillus trueperi]SDO00693.1 hypothetical protein SAMN05421677_102189 [Halobacillus aidingensis]